MKNLKVKNLNKNTYKSYEDIPMYLIADDICAISRMSKSKAYELFHSDDFPTIKIGGRLSVQKDDYFAWINTKKNKFSAV